MPLRTYLYRLVYKSYVNPHTVELLSKDILTILYKEQALWSLQDHSNTILQDHSNTILSLKEDNLSITVKLAGPKFPLFRGFTVYKVCSNTV